MILFDGRDLSQWVAARDGSPAGWTVADGAFTVVKSAGSIMTKRSFGSYQLHVEWRIPVGITGAGQFRGNSGVYLAWTGKDGYELQVLDSYQNATYVNGQAGSLYKQYPPLANAMRKPGEWQTYDVVWTAPTFDKDGVLVSPAYVTAVHNGVLVQDHVALRGVTKFIGQPTYGAHGPAPILLQAHGDPSPAISYRNISGAGAGSGDVSQRSTVDALAALLASMHGVRRRLTPRQPPPHEALVRGEAAPVLRLGRGTRLPRRRAGR